MRNINPTLLAAFTSSSVELYVAVEMLFDSSPLRLWSGLGEKTIGGNVYTGAGTLLGISGLEEGSDLSAKGTVISLSGVDTSLVSLALQEPYQNRVCKIYIGSGNNVLEVFSGFMDVMTISDSGDTCELAVSVEGYLIATERVNPLRYTQEVHNSRYPGDTFFSYVTKLADKSIVWGRELDIKTRLEDTASSLGGWN